MQFGFNRSDAERWAAFSGDFNPIHFDLDAARALGTDHLIVHGMLALLHAKAALWGASAPRQGWVQMRNLFRTPMPQEQTVRVLERAGGYRVCPADGEVEYMRGSLKPLAQAPVSPSAPAMARWIVEPRLLDAFHAAYPGLTPPWLAVEAAVFAVFMRTQLEAVFASAAGQVGQRRIDQARTHIVVHSSQTTAFDAAFFADPAGVAAPPRLRHGLARPDRRRRPPDWHDTHHGIRRERAGHADRTRRRRRPVHPDLT